jgi:peptidoglycan/xylan/chitin deacetylase (PgdA/CDA1 family)
MRILIVFALFLLTGCHNEEGKTAVRNTQLSTPSRELQHERKMADLSTILSRKEVPVLCYHNIRHFRPGESDRMKSYTVTPEAFAEQMKALSDSGYQTILPGELYDYLVYGASLPSKPIMISFDDTDAEQYSIGATEMNKYGFKGVYFVMTISINRPRYMKEAEIRNLSDSGHNISSHTWDHHMVTKYTGADWDSQFVKPKLRLEKITGKPVEYFAYPFGLWNKEAISELKTRGYKLAFILSTKRDSTEPLHTVRRMIVPGTWSTPGMMKAIRTTFNK